MTQDYLKDFKRAQKFVPQIKTLLAHYLVTEAPAEEDIQRNTDLVVLRLDKIRVACRVRRYRYLLHKDWKDQFTIRTERPLSGAETELAKLMTNWGNYFFYGFADSADETLLKWMLGDLNVFRLWFNRELAKMTKTGRTPEGRWEQKNGDGSSNFYAFWNHEMPRDFWVARFPEPQPIRPAPSLARPEDVMPPPRKAAPGKCEQTSLFD